jgi:hypothetical protein
VQMPIPECYDSPEDALRSAVIAMGGYKKVGPRMRPTFDGAAEWLRKCLSDDRRERLDPGQVIWILREANAMGFHSAMDYFAGETNYKAEPVNLAAQARSLEERIESGMQALNASMATLAKLKERQAQQ